VSALDLVAVDDPILDDAARLGPPELRTLDAIHIASARALGTSLGVVIAYDLRLVDAARAAGLPVNAPH
jgi:predicted nucleic acid-binding protein